MSDSVQPHRWNPSRLPHPWDSPGKNTGMGCHFLLQCVKVKSEREVTQSCPTLSDLVDCSLPGFSIHRIFQARVLEWGAIAFSVNFPYTCIFLFQIFYPFKLLQNIKQCPLSCTIDPFCFSILNIPECTCQSQTFTMNFLCPMRSVLFNI